VFVALRYRNFRLLWFGLGVSFAGSFMQQAAILWHVSLLAPPDRKALALGGVGLVRVVPILAFSLLAGVAADVFDRRKLMLVTQIGGAAVALVLGALAFAGVQHLWPIYVLAAFGAAVNAFDPPSRHALVPMLVSREDLPNALSLNSVMSQIASVLGPAVGGLIIATGHLAWAYVFNAVSFLSVVVALLMMRDVPATERGTRDAAAELSFSAARDGLRHVFRSPIIRSTMLLDFFATFFSSATALLPIFAQDVLRVGPQGYGWLYSASAVGSAIGSLALVPLAHRLDHRGRILIWAVSGYGLATVVFGVSHWFWLTFACLALSGTCDAFSMVIRNLVRQLETPDALRGRTVGISMVFFMGGPQLGELEAGLVGQWLGPAWSVITGGLGCLAATGVIAATTPELRRYRREATRFETVRRSAPPKGGRPEVSD
jgi:MFS family permease